MADQIQRYRQSPLRTVKKLLVRTDTARIFVPGQQFPARVEFTRPRWGLMAVVGVIAVVAITFLLTRVLSTTAPVPVTVPAAGSARAQSTAACVPDTVHLIVAKVKDKFQVMRDDTLLAEFRYGEVLSFDGTVERNFRGPGWGHLNLSSQMRHGRNVLRFIGVHEQGLLAGAEAEIRINGQTFDIVQHPFGFHDRPGVFMNRVYEINVNMCPQE